MLARGVFKCFANAPVFLLYYHFEDRDTIGFAQQGQINYFPSRDKLVEGQFCKSLEDYTQTARRHGFEIDEIEEARVDPEHLNDNPAFFNYVNGVPLHLVMKLRKPDCRLKNSTNAATSANTLTMLPKKLTWSNAAMRHPENAFFLPIPDRVKQELYEAASMCYDRGLLVDDIDAAGDFPSSAFHSLRSFASSVRNSVLHETGLVLLNGLDLDVFGDGGPERMVACSKIAYYLICSHIGAVDGTARGRLFDVKNNHIDAMDKHADNVLFSVSDCEGTLALFVRISYPTIRNCTILFVVDSMPLCSKLAHGRSIQR